MFKHKFILSAALAVIVPEALAQLPYTAGNAVPPHSSRSYQVRGNEQLNGASVPLANTGMNLVWDLSSIELEPMPDRLVYFEPADLSPYHSHYPSANLVVWEMDLFGSKEFQYFNNSPFELRLLGGVHETDQPNLVSFCPDPFLVLDYPMTLGSGVQHVYDCQGAQGEIDNWVIMGTGSLVYDAGVIPDVVMWRSIFDGPGYSDTSYFWTTYDNVLFPVAKYNPGERLQVRRPVGQTLLDIQEQSTSAAFSIHPNPTEGMIMLLREDASQQAEVRLFDALGREAISARILHSTATRLELDLHHLPDGFYLLELRDATGHAQQRLVKR